MIRSEDRRSEADSQASVFRFQNCFARILSSGNLSHTKKERGVMRFSKWFMNSLYLLVFGTLALAAIPAGGYHLLKRIPLGAAEGGGEYFDYITIDPAARRAYLSHG